MSDLTHILYTCISTVISVIILVLSYKFIKTDKSKDRFLKFWAIITVILHFSILYVDFFTYGTAEIGESLLLPVYPCNIAMWLLVVTAFIKKDSKIFTALAIVTFYLGIIGGVVGIVFNENYMNTPSLADYSVLKGLLSHSTMLIGCIYLLVGKYFKIRVSNMPAVVGGLLFLILDGLLMIGLFRLFIPHIDPPNCMFLLENPFPQITWFNPWILGIGAGIVIFAFTVIYEQFAVEKGERWYNKIAKFIEEKKKKNS